MQITDEMRAEYLEHLQEGKNPQQAAETIAEQHGDPRITATKFKFLRKRDPAFNLKAIEAEKEGKGSLVDRLERCAVEMAEGGHWPALRFMLTTYGEQFMWARSSKVEIGGQVEITAIAGILSRYLPSEMYDQLMDVVEQRMVEEGAHAIPPAVGKAA